MAASATDPTGRDKVGASRGFLLAVPCLAMFALLCALPQGVVALPTSGPAPVVVEQARATPAPTAPPDEGASRTALAIPAVASSHMGGSATHPAVAPASHRFRVRLLDPAGTPLAGVRLRAWVHDRVWLGDAVCDADGLASFPDARGLRVRIAPREEGEGWSAELGSSTHDVVQFRVQRGSGPSHVPD
ncbi:MAG: hypothetical protein RIT25_2626 [Planctomycetota bacterium]